MGATNQTKKGGGVLPLTNCVVLLIFIFPPYVLYVVKGYNHYMNDIGYETPSL